MADWNNPNPINTSPGGDTVYDGFVKTQSNFDNIYSKLNIVKKLQSGRSAPLNPAVGELWFDETSGILKRYDGTNWVDVVAIPSLSNVADTTILNKLKNVDGVNSGLDADLVRGLPADFTSSLAGSGYQKLPSGLIIQWGAKAILPGATTGTAMATVNFPIMFPNYVLSVALAPQSDFWSPKGLAASFDYVNNSSIRLHVTAVDGQFNTSSSYFVHFIAIGK